MRIGSYSGLHWYVRLPVVCAVKGNSIGFYVRFLLDYVLLAVIH